MPTTTTNQGLPLPTNTDDPNIPEDLTSLATAIESRLVLRYANTSDRSTKNPSPTEGQFSYLTGDNTFWFYNGSAWAQLYLYSTPRPTFHVGTSAPSSGTGVNGDVYFRV